MVVKTCLTPNSVLQALLTSHLHCQPTNHLYAITFPNTTPLLNMILPLIIIFPSIAIICHTFGRIFDRRYDRAREASALRAQFFFLVREIFHRPFPRRFSFSKPRICSLIFLYPIYQAGSYSTRLESASLY